LIPDPYLRCTPPVKTTGHSLQAQMETAPDTSGAVPYNEHQRRFLFVVDTQ
jgi:hypothetical protein